MNIEKHYDTAEVAKKFSVTEYTVREWLRFGVIEGVKINGRWKVPHSELVRLATEKYGDK